MDANSNIYIFIFYSGLVDIEWLPVMIRRVRLVCLVF